MKLSGLLNAGLGSRFALRTYLLFVACSLLPVGIFGGIGYAVVSKELRSHAQRRLAEASKHYGLLLNERLIQIENALVELARLHGSDKATSLSSFGADTRLRKVTLRQEALPLPQSETHSDIALDKPSLRIKRSPDPTVVMEVAVLNNGRKTIASGELVSDDLWDVDAVALTGMTLCASVESMQLICRGGEDAGPAQKSEETLSERWTLFLLPRYGALDWTIEARQPTAVALEGLRTFTFLLSGAAGLAFLSALLISAIQIRRSHQPFSKLISAARLMSDRRFDTRVKVEGNDEFSQLGRAFNGLAAGLQRQFHFLRAFSRIDRQILANPEIEPLIHALLPRASRLMRAQVVMLAIQDNDQSTWLLYSFTVGQTSVSVQTMTGELLSEVKVAPEGQVLSKLSQHADADLSWSSTTIVVKDKARGVLIVGRSTSGSRREDNRHLKGLGRRLAVALANEDRERMLLRQAYYDALTALPNRQLFKDRLAQEILRSTRDGCRVVLFFIDLDHFKNVNDSLGHSAGDELLCAAAGRLQDVLRAGDTLARLGGDEFTLVAPGLDDIAAESMARRMIEVLSHPFNLGGMQCVVQASIGIAVYPRDSDTSESLLRSADTAMYRAKAQGRGRAVFFEEAMNATAVRRLALEQRLRLAIAGGTLRLAYQPKFAAADCRLVGVEALARWQDAIHGNVSPAEFIPLAEECGLIEPLGIWCLRSACASMRNWKSRGLEIGHVAVNVSMQQLRNRDFPELVRRTLLDHGLEPADLEIEVTESMLAGDIREVAALLGAVRQLGVRVAIDDFGTGYSSMVALQQLPADVVKIDRAFVEACHEPQGLALLRALIAAGHAFGREVVAEGVETEAQFATLQACRCDIVQGYLLGMPQTAEELERSCQVVSSSMAVG